MKKKYLKKMLAIALAAMTVSATPGLVGAIRPESKKIIDYVDSKIKNHKLNENEAADLLNKLKSVAEDPDDDAKEKVAEDIKYLLLNTRLYRDKFKTDKELRNQILDIWNKCSERPAAGRIVAHTINNFVFFRKNKKAKDAVKPILDILKKCANHPNAISYVADAIVQIAQRGWATKDSLGQMLDALHNTYSNSPDDAAATIAYLAKNGLLDEQSVNEDLINMLKECAQHNDYHNVRGMVPFAIKEIAEKNLLNQFDSNKIKDIVNFLPHFLNNDSEWVKNDFANAIKVLNEKGLLSKCESNKIQQIVSTLIPSFANNKTVDDAANAVRSMAQSGLLSNHCTTDQIRQIVDKLISYLKYEPFVKELSLSGNAEKNRPYSEAATNLVAVMAQSGLLSNHCTTDQIRQIVDKLINRLNNNPTSEAATNLVAIMAQKGLLAKCEPDKARQIVNTLGQDMGNDLNNKYYLSVDKTFKVLQRYSKVDDLKASVANFADALINGRNYAKNDLFLAYLREETPNNRLSDLIDILHSCSKIKDADSTKITVASAFAVVMSKFNNKNLFSTYTPNLISQNISDIIEMLKNCSTIDDAKLDVVSAVRFLGNQGFLREVTAKGKSSDLIDTLSHCLEHKDVNNKNIEKMTKHLSNKEDLLLYYDMTKPNDDMYFMDGEQVKIATEVLNLIRYGSLSEFEKSLSDQNDKQRYDDIVKECNALAEKLDYNFDNFDNFD